jgi:hypothetical protein
MLSNARSVAGDRSRTSGATINGIIASARTIIGPSTARENRLISNHVLTAMQPCVLAGRA